MKSRKFLSLVAAILAGLALLLACEQNDAVRHRYQAEKMYHEAEKLARDIQIRPELITGEQQQQLRDMYARIFDFCLAGLDSVNRDSHPQEFQELASIAHRSGTRLSQLLYAGRHFDTSIAVLRNLLGQVPLTRTEQLSTKINLGQAMQSAGRWDSAVAVYSEAVENYYPPLDDQGEIIFDLFNLPMHITRVFRLAGDTIGATEYLRRGEAYYDRFIQQQPESILATASHANLGRMYYDAGQWHRSIEHLSHLVDSTGTLLLGVALRIADIYAGRLHVYDTALQAYDRLHDRLTGRDTLLRPIILVRKSRVQIDKKRYGEARRLLVSVSEKYPRYYEMSDTAQYLKARTFDLEGNWNRAETEYKFLIEQYTGSELAMSTHLYLAERLASMGREGESERWYDRAEEYYDRIASRNPGRAEEARALTYKANLFKKRKQWDRAATILTEIYNKFPRTRLGRDAILTSAAVYRERLNNPATADSLVDVLRRSLINPEEQWEE